jgi:hypothetical protein
MMQSKYCVRFLQSVAPKALASRQLAKGRTMKDVRAEANDFDSDYEDWEEIGD